MATTPGAAAKAPWRKAEPKWMVSDNVPESTVMLLERTPLYPFAGPYTLYMLPSARPTKTMPLPSISGALQCAGKQME
eukprot:Skav206080  [mRNA]  locus=scaffold6699:6982:8431:+ [translate_table: standard]